MSNRPCNSLAEGPGQALRLTLPGTMDACDTARQQVEAFLAPHAPSVKALFHIELVLEEVLTNQRKYAFDGKLPHETELRLQVTEGSVVLCFEDEGVAFDPLQVVVPVMPKSLETSRPGKLGIFLVRRYSQSVDYARVGGRNRLTVDMALR